MPRRRTNETLLEWLDRTVPPFLCYALAGVTSSRTRKWFGHEGIAKRAKMSSRTISRIADAVSWLDCGKGKGKGEGGRLITVSGFLDACCIDPRNYHCMRRQRKFLLQTLTSTKPFPHLSEQQYQRFQKRCAEWQRRQKALRTKLD